MALKKYSQLYGGKSKKDTQAAELTKLNNEDKQLIEKLKTALQNKLKDPQIAKKAAQLLNEWIQSQKK